METLVIVLTKLGVILEDIDDAVREWLGNFLSDLDDQAKGYTDVLHHMIQLGVDDPEACECKKEGGIHFSEDETLVWLHEHHRQYNRVVWEIISQYPGMFSHMRRVLRDDLRVFSDENEKWRQEWIEANDTSEGYHDFGKLVRHDYARKLLDHFLWADRSKADWT